ncbi:MAG: peptide deformylase [Magnetococcales bacterium]|nr:peptide deformylase [Magnetococcales bacterium]
MALLTILTAPDKRLKKKSEPIGQVDSQIQQLMDNMAETMYAANGIGLAAPQVGIHKQVIVVDVNYPREGAEKNPIFLANPKIIESEGISRFEEGCLSVPDQVAEVERAERIVVQGLGRNGEPVVMEAEDILAICLQHEIDHLSGILFIDHLSRLKRSIILKKLKTRKET